MPPPRETPAALPAFTAMDRLAAGNRQPKPSIALAAAWVLTFGVLIGGAASAVVWRGAIVHAWPPSARILGIPDGLQADLSAGSPKSGGK